MDKSDDLAERLEAEGITMEELHESMLAVREAEINAIFGS